MDVACDARDRRRVRRIREPVGLASTSSCTRSPSRRARQLAAASSKHDAREFPDRARHLQLQPHGAREGRRPMMQGRAGAILTLSYLGAVRSMPSYNVMGLAKASLEANVRFLAADLGPQGIRVNAISAGRSRRWPPPASSGFRKMLDARRRGAPLRRNVTIEDVGNAAAFLCSDLASGITGEVSTSTPATATWACRSRNSVQCSSGGRKRSTSSDAIAAWTLLRREQLLVLPDLRRPLQLVHVGAELDRARGAAPPAARASAARPGPPRRASRGRTFVTTNTAWSPEASVAVAGAWLPPSPAGRRCLERRLDQLRCERRGRLAGRSTDALPTATPWLDTAPMRRRRRATRPR